MAINDEDELSKILGDKAQSSRINNWTWHYLVNFHNFPRNSSERYLDRDAMADFIKAQRIESIVHNRFAKSLLPDAELQWISNNERQISWVMRHLGIHTAFLNDQEAAQNFFSQYVKWGIPTLINTNDPPQHIFTIPGLNHQSLIYLVIDLNHQDLSRKRFIISSTKNEWEIREERDKIFDFFADSSPEKFQILKSTTQKELKDRLIPNLNNPDINHILTSFDLVAISDIEIRSLVAKCRTIYNQKIRRSKPDAKRQCNLLLPESTIVQLEKLARKHGFSRSEVMEILIKNEHKHEIYLKERVELKKRLLADDQNNHQEFI